MKESQFSFSRRKDETDRGLTSSVTISDCRIPIARGKMIAWKSAVAGEEQWAIVIESEKMTVVCFWPI
ncbi:MAG: hypothetical protein ABI286_11305 [Edaphobacter sp.]